MRAAIFMGRSVYEILKERGFVEQVTDEQALMHALKGPVTCYAGFDPTASSLHVGHLLPIMALAHMQLAGHRPIALLGGGTALIGDPSGKNEMRKILSYDEVKENGEKIKKQFARYLDFGGTSAALQFDNAEWLAPLRYIEFLRDIGRHFSVNRMLAAESYKMRLETGLNFIEFNYMLLQSYDFLYLNQNHTCLLQIGGNDQWGNIVAGIDLIRRVEGKEAYGLTFPLITTASGAKMGKTEKGAVWLDAERTSAYEYYQYWVNADDRDVARFLAYFTFLPMEEVRSLTAEGANINAAKQRLAFEAAAITHGKEAAEKAQESSRSVFYGDGAHLDSVPATEVELKRLEEGIAAFMLFTEAGLCTSRSDARRLVAEGGAYINGERLDQFDTKITNAQAKNGIIMLRAGKKRFHKIEVV
jgi:tyrosyl-tRNA synthetase